MINKMKISPVGIDLIKSHEGCRFDAYLCPAGIETIGYGHTGRDVHPGMTITQYQADVLLEYDLIRFEAAINQFVKSDINQAQFDALVSFVYNIGVTAFVKSTLLRKVNENPDESTISDEFMRWVRGNGKMLPGLVTRRIKESELYFS